MICFEANQPSSYPRAPLALDRTTLRPTQTHTDTQHAKKYNPHVPPPMAAAQSRADVTEQSRSLSMLAARGRGLAPFHEAGGRAGGEGGAPPTVRHRPLPSALAPCRLPRAADTLRARGASGAHRLGQRQHQAAAAAAGRRHERLYGEVVRQHQARGRRRRADGGGGGGGGGGSVLATESVR